MINYLSKNGTLYRGGYIATTNVEVIEDEDVIVIDGTAHRADDIVIQAGQITSKLSDDWWVSL